MYQKVDNIFPCAINPFVKLGSSEARKPKPKKEIFEQSSWKVKEIKLLNFNMGFKEDIKNDETYETGIARFEVETHYSSEISWRKGILSLYYINSASCFKTTLKFQSMLQF